LRGEPPRGWRIGSRYRNRRWRKRLSEQRSCGRQAGAKHQAVHQAFIGLRWDLLVGNLLLRVGHLSAMAPACAGVRARRRGHRRIAAKHPKRCHQQSKERQQPQKVLGGHARHLGPGRHVGKRRGRHGMLSARASGTLESLWRESALDMGVKIRAHSSRGAMSSAKVRQPLAITVALRFGRELISKLRESRSRNRNSPPTTLRTNRNRDWTAWLIERLEKPGTVLFAVGAGHLAGPESVQQMLATRGLEAQRIDIPRRPDNPEPVRD
jgi:hypothetical protein